MILLLAIGLGCGFFDRDAPDTPDAQPAATPTATPAPPGTSSDPPPVAAPARCALVFTPEDANAAFAAVGALDSDCAFEGIKAQKSQLVLRWKPTPDTEVQLRLTPEVCAEAPEQVLSGLAVQGADDVRKACPKTATAALALVDAGGLPAPGPPEK